VNLQLRSLFAAFFSSALWRMSKKLIKHVRLSSSFFVLDGRDLSSILQFFPLSFDF